jgi:acid phosphatase
VRALSNLSTFFYLSHTNAYSLKLRYPNLNANVILASGEDRVIESAQWFGAGYFGRDFNPSSVAVLPEDNTTISYLTPQETCPKWPGVTFLSPYSAASIPPIMKRLNAAVPAVNFSATDVLGAFLDCPFDLSEKGPGRAPWCEVFTKDEWAIYEYVL